MAQNLQQYDRNYWVDEMPITAARTNKAEEGIAMNRNALMAMDNDIEAMKTQIQERPTTTSMQSYVDQQVGQGSRAYAEVVEAHEGNKYTSLANRFATNEADITDINGMLGTKLNPVTEQSEPAYSSTSTVYGAVSAVTRTANLTDTEVRSARTDSVSNVTYDSLYLHLRNIDVNIDNAKASILTIENAAGTNRTLASRMAQLDQLQSEVDAARRAVGAGESPDNLAKRFASIDAQIQAIQNDISGLGNSKVNVSDIIDNLTSNNTNKPLSANMGKTLRDLIGGVYDATNTVTAAINAAEASAKAYTDQKNTDYHVAEINAAHRDSSDTLDARFDDIETEINTAHRNLGTDPETEEVIVDSLNRRFLDTEADIATLQNELAATHTAGAANLNTRLGTIESNAAALANDLHAIAEELAMLDDQDAIKSTNTKIDDLEADVQSFARELAMSRDDNGRLVETSTRVDTIEGEITSAHRTNEDTLDARFDSIETAISHAAGDNDAGGLTERVGTLENTTATRQSVSDLAGRVSTLESQPKSATTVIEADRITYDAATGAPTIYTDSTKTILVTPSTDVDYLLQKEDKYYYWKYIQVSSSPDTFEWALISGGSGSGNGNTTGYDLSAEEFDALTLEDVNENTDYYVTRDDGVHHYRYVNTIDAETGLDTLTKVEIGQFVDLNKIKRYNIGTEEGQVDGKDVTYLNLYQYDYDALNNDISTEDEPFARVILPKGGDGSISTSKNRLIRIGDQVIQKIVGNQIFLRVFYSSWDSEGLQSNDGAYTLRTGNTVIETGTLNSGSFTPPSSAEWPAEETKGYYEFDVTKYCNIGNTSFALSVVVNGTTIGQSWTVNIIDLHLESEAPEVLLINATEAYNFPYVAFGALSKTLNIIIDNDAEHKITQTLSSVTSGRAAFAVIPAQEHGAHKIEMYLTAVVGGVSQTTDSIIREYIWYDVENTSEPLILASPKNGQTITAQQYSTIEIPYQIYKKGVSSITVEYYADNVRFDAITLEDTNTGTLSYLASEQGAHTLKIMVDNDEETALIINLNITELDIDVSPVAGAIIDFDPTMLTNSSVNRLPNWTVGSNTYSLTASDNFNWSDDASGGGYKNDVDGKAFVIKAGSYVDLNYPMFSRDGNNNILTKGAEMKIIFKVSAVRNINAVWYYNTGVLTEKTVGIQLGAHSGWLKTDKATDTSTAAVGSDYPKWTSGTTYALDDIVTYKDTIYKCIKLCEDHTDIVPGTSDASSYWSLLSGEDIPSDTTGIEAWETGNEYEKDTIVSYNSSYYKCKKNVINEITSNPKTAADNWLSMGKMETEVQATNSYLYMPYSEEDKIELDININKYNSEVDTNFIMSYEDGVPSKAYAYEYGAAGDGLYHDNTIRIGSDDCDIYIYHLRIYNQALSTADILQNFIADGNGISEKVARYNRNCIYWDSTQEKYFTSPSATAILDPIKLAEVMPDVKVLMLDTPVFTVGKKNFVQGSSLRCIHADGGNIYKSRGDADNWLFTNGFHSGQGTTSDNYGQSARNVDFLFEVDGVNYPTKKKNMGTYKPSTDYVSKVYIGEDASEWNGTTWVPTRVATDLETCDNWKGDKCKISLTETSVPNNYFNLKVNVASSENVNNALFQKRYDDFLVYNAPSQTAQIAKHRAAYNALGQNPNNIKVKNSMEFVPAVLFVRENQQDQNGNPVGHTEFNDCNWHFYALGNIGDSKKTDYTRAYDPDDMNEFTCENSDNNTNNGQFQSGVFMYNGHAAIETPFEAYDSEKTYKDKDIVVNNGVIQVYNGETWSDATLTGWTESAAPYFAPYTAPNTMQYLYPISSSAWNVQVNGEYVNYKHYTLVNEEFDGDHSFEFRYACRGDYRDGDLINETEGQDDDAQFNLNHDVVLAFYEWLVTATEEQYAVEAPQWFVKSAMEFFYAYTHYYTMMDNRAKNTFWHFAKTGNYIEVSRPVKALLHVYEESTDNGETWQKATGTEIDPDKKYRTQYAFDLWAYDMDRSLSM